ncbi:hypothetical protein GCM10028791_24660 [Echinicola sediminis]
MITLLFKNWRFIVDVLLVLAVVLLLFWWNPMGLFGGGLKLEDSANMVTEVNEIGELVTAEYYGEVITSIDEARLNPLQNEEISERAAVLYADLLVGLQNLHDYQSLDINERTEEYRQGPKIRNWRKIIRQDVDSKNIMDKMDYHGFLTELQAEPLFDDLLEFLWREEVGADQKDAPKEKELRELLFRMYKGLDENADFTEEQKNRFIQTYHSNVQEGMSRKALRKKLTMIGRGWVKAGFDFSDLGEESILYYEDLGEIHLIGISPKILNADINPWFIPEKGIPGFQILDEKGPVNFYDAKKVKQYCIDKLTVYAHQARILDNAKSQGAETLKNLFSLLTGNEIKKVIFHDTPFLEFVKLAEEDEMISYAEAYVLDSLVRLEVNEIKALKTSISNRSVNLGFAEQKERVLKQVLSRFQMFPYQVDGSQFNYFSKLSTDIALDSLIDDQEDSVLTVYREVTKPVDILKKDSLKTETFEFIPYWMEEPYPYIQAYNQLIGTLQSASVMRNVPDSIMVSQQTFGEGELFSNHKVVDYKSFAEGDSIRLFVLTDSVTDKYLRDKLYPVTINQEMLSRFLKNKEILSDATPKSNTSLSKDSLEHIWLFDIHTDKLQVYQLALKLEEMLPPLIAQKFKEDKLLKINEGLVFIKETDSLKHVLSDKEPSLNQSQSLELEAFFRTLMDAHQEERHKSFLEKTKDWVNSKTKEKQGATIYLNSNGLKLKEN